MEKFYMFYKAIGPSRPLNETSTSPGNLRLCCHKNFVKAYHNLRLIRLRLWLCCNVTVLVRLILCRGSRAATERSYQISVVRIAEKDEDARLQTSGLTQSSQVLQSYVDIRTTSQMTRSRWSSWSFWSLRQRTEFNRRKARFRFWALRKLIPD